MRGRVIGASLAAGLAVLGAVASVGLAEPRHGEVLLMEMVTVTGTLLSVADPDGQRWLEIVSDLGGHYRIAQTDRSAPLREHLGEHATVVAIAELSPDGSGPLLRVQRFTLYDG